MASIFGRLMAIFGGAGRPGEGDPGRAEDYKGFRIQAAPMRDGSKWLTAGFISKSIDGDERQHRFIRADTHASREDAESFSLTKARLIVDEQGERLFDL